MAERLLVRQAVETRTRGQIKPEPQARALAHRVVHHLRGFIADEADPAVAAFGAFTRIAFSTPAMTLATDPEIDTLSLYVDARVARFRARNGRSLSVIADKAEQEDIFQGITLRLTRRYLDHLRADRSIRGR